MSDAPTSIDRFSSLFSRGVISPGESAMAVIDSMLYDEACDPAALFGSLSNDARAAILNEIRQYEEKDYLVKYFYIGPGETPQDGVDRQPKLRALCHALLGR